MDFLIKNSVPVHLARREALPMAVNEALRVGGASFPGSSLLRKPSAAVPSHALPASALAHEAQISAPKVPSLTPTPAAPPSPSIMRLDVQRAALEAQSQAHLAQREQVLSTRLRSNPLDEAFTRLKTSSLTPTSSTSPTSSSGASKIASPELKPVRLEVELTSRMGRAEERAATAVEQRLLDDQRIEAGLSAEQVQSRRQEQSHIEQEQRFGRASSGRGHLLKSAGHDWAANVLSLGQELAQVSGAEGFAQYQKTQREEHQAAAEYHRSQAIKRGRIVEWEQVTQEGQYAVKGIGQASFSTSEGPNGSFQTSLNSALAFSGRLGEYIETLYLQSSPYLLESVAGGFGGRAVAGSLQLGAQGLRRAGLIGAAAVSLPSSSGRVLQAQREHSQALHGVEETHLPSALALGGVGAAVNAVLGVDRMLASLSTQVLNPARLAAVPALARPVVGAAVQVGAVTGGEAITEVVQGFTERSGAKVATDKMAFFTLDYGRQVLSELRDGGLMGWAGGSVGQAVRATRAAADEAKAWLHTQEAAAPRIVDSNGKVLYVEKKPTSTSELLPELLQGLKPRHDAEPSVVGIHPSQLLGWLVPPRQQFVVPPKPDRGGEGGRVASTQEEGTAQEQRGSAIPAFFVPVGGPVMDHKRNALWPQAIAMPTNPDGMGRSVSINPSISRERSGEVSRESAGQVEASAEQKQKNQSVNPSRLARALLGAEHGTLEELLAQLQQRETRAASLGAEAAAQGKYQPVNKKYYDKLSSLVLKQNGSLRRLLPLLQTILRPGESATESVRMLIHQPENWALDRTHVRQVDASMHAIERIKDMNFKVMEALAHGDSKEFIAQKLGLAVENVEIRLSQIFDVLGVYSRPDLLLRYPDALEGLARKVEQVKQKRLSVPDIHYEDLSVLPWPHLRVLADLVAGIEPTLKGGNRTLTEQTLGKYISWIRNKLGVTDIDQIIARYAGEDLRGDLLKLYAQRPSQERSKPSFSKKVEPNVFVELMRQAAHAYRSEEPTAHKFEHVFRVNPISLQPGQTLHDQVNALSRNAVAVSADLIHGLPPNDIAVRMGLSLRTVETYEYLIPRMLGETSFEKLKLHNPNVDWPLLFGQALKRREASESVPLTVEETHKFVTSFGGAVYTKSLAQGEFEGVEKKLEMIFFPDLVKRINAYFIGAPDDVVKALWAHKEGFFRPDEIEMLSGGRSKKSARKHFMTELDVGKDSMGVLLELYAKKGESPKDFLWKLVTDRRTWAAENFSTIKPSDVEQVLREFTSEEISFLKGRAQFGDDDAKILQKMNLTDPEKINDLEERIEHRFGVSSWIELDLRVDLSGTAQDRPIARGDGLRALIDSIERHAPTKSSEINPSAVARVLLEADLSVLNELARRVAHIESGTARAYRTDEPIAYKKMKTLVSNNQGSMANLVNWVRSVIGPTEDVAQSLELLKKDPGLWAQGRANVRQIDTSTLAVTKIEGVKFHVLEEIVKGQTKHQIAQTLGIEPDQVSEHSSAIYQALGAFSLKDLKKRYPGGLVQLGVVASEVKQQRLSGLPITASALDLLSPGQIHILSDLVAGKGRAAAAPDLTPATLITSISDLYKRLGITLVPGVDPLDMLRTRYDGDLAADLARRMPSPPPTGRIVAKDLDRVLLRNLPILADVLAGKDLASIARARNLSEKTISDYLSEIRAALNIKVIAIKDDLEARYEGDLAADLNKRLNH